MGVIAWAGRLFEFFVLGVCILALVVLTCGYFLLAHKGDPREYYI